MFNVCYKLSTISQEQKLTHAWIIIIIARLSANVLEPTIHYAKYQYMIIVVLLGSSPISTREIDK